MPPATCSASFAARFTSSEANTLHAAVSREKSIPPRSTIPAVTHVDFSARIQTVRRDENPLYYDLLRAFERLTGCPVLVNTSFNVRGEPIVCSPEHAYTCFMRTEMDYLVMGDFILDKTEQGGFIDTRSWQEEFQLD